MIVSFPLCFKDAERSLDDEGWSPAVDIYETADELAYTVELPGFEKDQIKISVNDGRLTVSGERKFKEDKDTRVSSNQSVLWQLLPQFSIAQFSRQWGNFC